MAIQRITVLGVPVDILQPQNLESEIMELLVMSGTKQIVFLSIWDLLKARGNNEFAQCVKNADLILPTSKSIIRGAKFLKKAIPVRYNPFTTVIDVLTILENHLKTVYLLGGRKRTLTQAEQKLHLTYKDLQIVGRYVGYYPKDVEDDIIEAIKKASPSLVLLSEGIREKDNWAYARRDRFSTSIFLYYHDALGIFSERIQRVSEKKFNKGKEFWADVKRNPLKLFLVFPYLWYIMSLVWERMLKKNK